MGRLRFLTAGESHGPGLSVIVEGLPAGLELLAEHVDSELARRQRGYGRGARMKIETDAIEFIGGVRHGKTLGGPVAMLIRNRDHINWLDVMNPAPVDLADEMVNAKLTEKYITRVRPGHADFAGSIKYNFDDVRNVLERSSARETTSRVAAGALAKRLLSELNVQIRSQVVRIGSVAALPSLMDEITADQFEAIEQSETRAKTPELTSLMKEAIDAARKQGESLGGTVQLFVYGLPVGIGSYVHWDRRLDGILAGYLMSVHTVKAVAFGIGEMAGIHPGSQVHDEITVSPSSAGLGMRYSHTTNRAGGIEGGMTNGEPLVVSVTVKPIPTLARPQESSLKAIDLATKSDAVAFYERSDVCVVPAASVVCEAMIAIGLADQLLYKFGGDSIGELKDNYNRYSEYCRNR